MGSLKSMDIFIGIMVWALTDEILPNFAVSQDCTGSLIRSVIPRLRRPSCHSKWGRYRGYHSSIAIRRQAVSADLWIDETQNSCIVMVGWSTCSRREQGEQGNGREYLPHVCKESVHVLGRPWRQSDLKPHISDRAFMLST